MGSGRGPPSRLWQPRLRSGRPGRRLPPVPQCPRAAGSGGAGRGRGRPGRAPGQEAAAYLRSRPQLLGVASRRLAALTLPAAAATPIRAREGAPTGGRGESAAAGESMCPFPSAQPASPLPRPGLSWPPEPTAGVLPLQPRVPGILPWGTLPFPRRECPLDPRPPASRARSLLHLPPHEPDYPGSPTLLSPPSPHPTPHKHPLGQK